MVGIENGTKPRDIKMNLAEFEDHSPPGSRAGVGAGMVPKSNMREAYLLKKQIIIESNMDFIFARVNGLM